MRSTTWTLRRRFRVEKAEPYEKILLKLMFKEEQESTQLLSKSKLQQKDLEDNKTIDN